MTSSISLHRSFELEFLKRTMDKDKTDYNAGRWMKGDRTLTIGFHTLAQFKRFGRKKSSPDDIGGFDSKCATSKKEPKARKRHTVFCLGGIRQSLRAMMQEMAG